MSSSIRPPGSPGPAPAGVDSAHATEGLEGARGLEGTQAATVQGATPEASAQGVTETSTAQWIKRLEAGEVTRAEAVEGLVAEAVQRHGGARLPPALRGELEGVLRAALLEDPVLSRLLGEG